MRLALLATVAVALMVAPVQAQAAGGPKARADAQRLVRVYLSFEDRVSPRLRQLEREYRERFAACPINYEDAPDRDAATFRMAGIYLRAAVESIQPQLARHVRRIRALPARDRTVKRVARAMARSNGLLRKLAEPAPDPCAYFEAWQAAGWTPEFRIAPPVYNFSEAELSALHADARTVRRALPRLRRLGVSRSRITKLRDAWSDDDVYDKIAL